MTRKIYVTFLILVVNLIFFPSMSSAIDFSCPESIPVNEEVKNAPSSWQPVSDSQTHYFKGVRFYSGHPKEMAWLIPDDELKGKDIWKFPAKKSNEYWLACVYLQTGMMLTKQLPQGLSECEVVYAKSSVKSITCR